MSIPLNIDQYSFGSIPIEMKYNDLTLSVGTAFAWAHERHHYLITNWHCLAGRNPQTGDCLSKTGGLPNRVNVWFALAGGKALRKETLLPLLDENQKPLWLIHPDQGR